MSSSLVYNPVNRCRIHIPNLFGSRVWDVSGAYRSVTSWTEPRDPATYDLVYDGDIIAAQFKLMPNVFDPFANRQESQQANRYLCYQVRVGGKWGPVQQWGGYWVNMHSHVQPSFYKHSIWMVRVRVWGTETNSGAQFYSDFQDKTTLVFPSGESAAQITSRPESYRPW